MLEKQGRGGENGIRVWGEAVWMEMRGRTKRTKKEIFFFKQKTAYEIEV